MMRLLATVMLALMLATPVRAAADRVAVLIGNAAYDHGEDLLNPIRDARALGSVLRDLGFRVYLGENVDRAGFSAMLANLLPKIEDAETVLFYYAGHGVQVDGATYLLPTDARMASRADLDTAVTLNEVLDILQHDLRANVVLIDSCRNNPIYGARSRSFGPGADDYEAPSVGTFIGYASQPGAVALDGEGPHSPFTQALIDHIATPGIDIDELMRRARFQTLRATGGAQVPWSQSSLLGPVVLNPPAPATAIAHVSDPAGTVARLPVRPAWPHMRAERQPFSLGQRVAPVAVPDADTAQGGPPAPAPLAGALEAHDDQPAIDPVAATGSPDQAMATALRRRALLVRLCTAIGDNTGVCAGPFPAN